VARTTFRFRLQRLLDVRIMREKQAQSELQARRQQVLVEEQKLAQLHAEEAQLREQQARPFQRGDDLPEFAMRRTFLEGAIKAKVQEQDAQHGRIQTAKQAVLVQQDVVKQCGIDVKALEKLRDKLREEHRLDQLREEGLYMDDLAGQGFLRRRSKAAMVTDEELRAAVAAAAVRLEEEAR
jgi:flagellar export protein FliJ